MKTSKEIGKTIRSVRKNLGITQMGLAMTCGTGTRFIIDLEKGKETCQIGKVLKVIDTLGIKIELLLPHNKRE